MNENKWRILFWGCIMVLCISLGTVGVIIDNKTIERDTIKLNNISNQITKLRKTEEYNSIGTKITSKVKKRKLIVTIETSNVYNYKYKLKDNILSIEYDKNDSKAFNATSIVIDAINTLNGGIEGEIYNMIANRHIYDYEIEDGIKITKDDYNTKVNIDVNKILTDNINNTNSN